MKGVTATALAFVFEEARDEVWEILSDQLDPWSLTDDEIVGLIDQHYPGGWQQFLRDGE
ncbi:hypothetical protein ACFWDN_13130 [Micromonospora chalcea]